MTNAIQPEMLDRWFPLERQHYYVEQLLHQQGGLTRRRAECFIRLWGYLMLKQEGKPPQTPIAYLAPVDGAVSCTHREAADLFYTDLNRGSDRAAGMMIDQLIHIGLVSKTFDGNTLRLGIWALPELTQPVAEAPTLFLPDDFNPRTDTIPVANFLSSNYNWMTPNRTTVAHKIVRVLRQWVQQYPRGIRVLRRCDDHQAVGAYIFFPTASTSDANFFLPPSHSLHLSTMDVVDPVEMATPGDPNCVSIFVRSWMIDKPYLRHATVGQFLRDSQKTLERMREDFPNLCDLYALPIHPSYEALAKALGFQKTIQDPQSLLCWMYIALDRFLELDIERAIAHLPL
jgi:hypothetical protein